MVQIALKAIGLRTTSQTLKCMSFPDSLGLFRRSTWLFRLQKPS